MRIKLVPEMGGPVARWYARQRGTDSQLAAYREQATSLTSDLPDAAAVLEVAPGPGYLAIEIARLDRYRVSGLDISRSFVDIARDNARKAGVSIDIRLGDVAGMPFDADSFDLIVCQAAFKNFTRPGSALAEMHRVLRPGGTAVIQDLRRDVSAADIRHEVERLGLTGPPALMIRFTLAGLRRRAHLPATIERLVADSPFDACTITPDGVGMEIRLTK